jgi:hypothetical protein
MRVFRGGVRNGLVTSAILTSCLSFPAYGGGSPNPSSSANHTSHTDRTSPTSPAVSTQTCRNYSAQETRLGTSSSGTPVGRITQTCNYSTAANEMTCTLNHDSPAYSVTVVFKYASTADFVDEVRVIPPLSYGTSGSTTYTPAGLAPSSTFTLTFDAQRRTTQRVTQFSNGTSQVVRYTGWDAAGRPSGAILSNPQGETLLYSYDDTARTFTIRTPSINSVQTHGFNADGNQISTVATVAGVTTTYTSTITSTGRVCR